MIVEYIRYELNQHTTEDLLGAYRAAAQHLRAAPECLGYELAVRDDAPLTCVLRIIWQSAEAHMSDFRRGPNFPPFLELIRPFIGEIAEMKHYSVSDVVWARE